VGNSVGLAVGLAVVGLAEGADVVGDLVGFEAGLVVVGLAVGGWKKCCGRICWNFSWAGSGEI
jgi:uncharacterized transporter YbjL